MNWALVVPVQVDEETAVEVAGFSRGMSGREGKCRLAHAGESSDRRHQHGGKGILTGGGYRASRGVWILLTRYDGTQGRQEVCDFRVPPAQHRRRSGKGSKRGGQRGRYGRHDRHRAVVTCGGYADIPCGRDGPGPRGHRRTIRCPGTALSARVVWTRCCLGSPSPTTHVRASSPVIASPTSPTAAMPRSPPACAEPEVPAVRGITGAAVRRERLPVTARPMLPPAATDRVPAAVAACATREVAGGRRRAYALTAAATRPPTDPGTVAIWADVSRSETAATIPSPNAAKPSSTTNSHTATGAHLITPASSQEGLTAAA